MKAFSGEQARKLTARGYVFLIALVLFVLAIVFWHSYYEAAFQGLIYNDAMDYASIARNIALGKGLISQYLTPLGLAHHGVPQPDLWRAPLWPLVLACFQKVFGFIDEASALAGGFCFAASAVFVFLLGFRFFNILVGITSCLLFIFSRQILNFSISGLTEPLAILLMLSWVAALSSFPVRRWWGGLLAGGITGLFYLCRYNAILFLLPGMVYWIWRFLQDFSQQKLSAEGAANCRNLLLQSEQNRFSQELEPNRRPYLTAVTKGLVFLLGFFLVVSPWLGRNFVLTGNPFFSLQKYEPAMFTRTYPGYSLYMIPERIDVLAFVRDHQDELLVKIRDGWNSFQKQFYTSEFTSVAVFVFWCFLFSLVLPLDKKYPRQRGIRLLLVSCFLAQLLALLPLHYISRLFIIFAPFYMIYAAGAVWWLVSSFWEHLMLLLFRGSREARKQERIFLLAVLVLTIFTIGGVWANFPDFQPQLPGPHPRNLRSAVLQDVAKIVPEDMVVVSNEGHLFAWYGKRYACKLPHSPALLEEVTRLAPVKALFVSNWITWNLPDADPAWVRFYLKRPEYFQGFRLVRVYPDCSLLYLRQE